MIGQALEKLNRTACLLKDAKQERDERIVARRVTQAHDDIHNIMALLRRARAKIHPKKDKSVASGVRAKSAVFAGRQEKTNNNLKKDHLKKNKKGKVVTKAASAAGSTKHTHIAPWSAAIRRARRMMGIQGFCAVGGKSRQGKQLCKTAKQELRRSQQSDAR